MTVFWLILAAGLMFFGRFGTDRIRSSNLADMAFRASQIAMLGCIGLAFFALFDRPAPQAVPAGGSSDLGDMALWTGFALGGPVVVAFLATSLYRHHRMGKNELITPELTLRLEPTEGMVHLSQRGQLAAHRIGAGRLVVEMIPYETEGVMRAGLVFRQWPAASSLSPETALKAVAEVFRTDVYTNTAKAVRRWLDRHPGVEFDGTVARLKWQQKVDSMVRHARGQVPKGKLVVESFVAYDGPALDYVAIHADGTVFAGTGEETLVEPVTRPLVSDGGRRVQVSVGNAYPTFALSNDQVECLRKLHAKGRVQVLEGRF